MKNNRRLVPLIALVISFLFSLISTPAFASTHLKVKPKNTAIELNSVPPVGLADSFSINGRIIVAGGNPLPEAHVAFYLDGMYIGQAESSLTGLFSLKVNKDFPAGSHTLSASYNGSHLYVKAAASTALVIKPTEVVVQAVPPIAGLSFKLDGRKFTTNRDGLAKIYVNRVGQYRLDVLVDEYQNPSMKIEFGRWSEEDYQPYRTIRVPSDEVIPVGINVFHQVKQDFVDLAGYPIEPGRITEYTIKSAQGDVFTFTDSDPHWLPASRIARRITGLEETKLLYSVIKVIVDGSNVVNQAQQRFYTEPNGTWDTTVMLYSMQISARDGIFDSPVGKLVNLEYPDGKIVSYPLDSAGNAEIHSLARGLYTFRLTGINGLSPKTPVALSRDQVVNIKVITYLDIAIVGILAILLMLGLLIYGRPWLINSVLRKKRGLVLDHQWKSIHEN